MKMSGLRIVFCRTNGKWVCLSSLLQFPARLAYLVPSPDMVPNEPWILGGRGGCIKLELDVGPRKILDLLQRQDRGHAHEPATSGSC